MKTYPVVLTIAGSDSSGGAGIQADLKTMSAIGVFGTSAITAITAQNTCEVRDIQGIEPDIVRQQIEAILDDLPCTTVKLGMLYSRDHRNDCRLPTTLSVTEYRARSGYGFYFGLSANRGRSYLCR